MAWVRIDDGFSHHPKSLKAGPLGMAMQIAGLCHSNMYLTDGVVSEATLPLLLDLRELDVTAAAVVEKLIAAEMWEKVEGGWQIHDYLEYQPSRATVLAEREAAKDRMARQRAKTRSEEVQANNDRTPAPCSPEVRPKFGPPDPVPIPDPGSKSDPEKELSPTQASESPDPLRKPFTGLKQQRMFDEFWQRYPRKRNKGKAEKAWVALKVDDALFVAIMKGLTRALPSPDWQREAGQFIPYPASWLNARGWEDEYKQVGAGRSQQDAAAHLTPNTRRAVDIARDFLRKGDPQK